MIGAADRERIAARLAALDDAGRELVVLEAAVEACDSLGVADRDARAYLGALAPELLPRIEVGLEHGSLAGIFVG